MTSRRFATGVDAADPPRLARWWGEALGTRLVFVPVSEPRLGKNRPHLDLVPGDQAAEVARFESVGGRRVEIGQSLRRNPPAFWVALQDPDGNEFCVLVPR